MKIKKILKSALYTVATVSFIAAMSITTQASDIGSGNGGGPSVHASTAWREIVGKPNTSQAWNKFLAVKGIWNVNEGYFAKNVVDPLGNYKSSSDERLSNICRRSEVIYYYSYPRSTKWTIEGSRTHKAPWIYTTDRGGTTSNASQRSKVTAHYWREFLNNSHERANWNRGQVVLICSGNLPVYEEFEERDAKPQTETRTITSEERLSGDISYYLKATPVKRQEFNSYTSAKKSEWNSKHKVQQSPTVKTEFGKYLDANPWSRVKNTKDWDAWKKGAQAAINKGKSNPQISFNKQVMSALQDGGIYTIMESGQHETFIAPFAQKQQRQRRVIEKVNKATGDVVSTRYGSWSAWSNVGGKELQKTTRNPQPVAPKYYQILSVRCNVDEYNAALRASGGSRLAIGSGDAMGAIITKPTTNPNSLPFGNPNHGNAALRKTASDKFFNQTKSCEANFACHVTKQSGAVNGSGDNINDSGLAHIASPDEKGGVARTNKFEFFRDNKGGSERTAYPNIWYAKDKGNPDISINSKAPAVRTKIAVDPNGTPTLGTTTIGLFDGNKKSIGTVKTPSSVVQQHVAGIEMKSEWASDAGKPQRIHLDWVYQGQLKSKLPTVVNGTGVTNTTTYDSPIFVGCSMDNNKGSGTNKADVKLSQDEAFKSVNFSSGRSHLEFMFNRAVSAGSKVSEK